MTKRNNALRHIETMVIFQICSFLAISIDDALKMWYGSQTYRKFSDESYGIAREGGMAMVERLAMELDLTLSR